MKKYNLTYTANGKTIQKNNITKEQVTAFIDTLPNQNESSLRVTEIKDRDEEER